MASFPRTQFKYSDSHFVTAGSALLREEQTDTGKISMFQSSLGGDRLTEFDMFFQTDQVMPSGGEVVGVDSSQRYQSIIGFGGAFTEASAVNLFSMPTKFQQEIIAAYFGSPDTSLGYSLCRTHINSCDFSLASYSSDDVPGDYNLTGFNIDHDKKFNLAMIKMALQHIQDERAEPFRLFGSPWSPPAWMKGNGHMDGSSFPGLLDDPKIHRAWALFMSKWVSAYKGEGVDVWGLTVQNEPANPAPWEACVYTAEQQRDFVKHYLGPRLKEDHPDLSLMIWDHNRDLVQEWAKVILSDPDAAQYIHGTAFHWYTGNSPGLNLYNNLDEAYNVDPTKFILASESCYCPGVSLNDWNRGEAYAVDILNDLKHWSSGWVDWNMILNMEGGPNHLGNLCDSPVIVDNEAGVVHYQTMFYVLGHFSKFIRPGAVRVATVLKAGQSCEPNPASTAEELCEALNWAANELGVDEEKASCHETLLTNNARTLFTQYYLKNQDLEGPSACDFGGTARLEGLQAVSFLNPLSAHPSVAGQIATVILNTGQTETPYTLSVAGRIATMTIPPRAIQTLLYVQ